MAVLVTKGKYHIALNGLGYMLKGVQQQPAYQVNQSPLYGNRFAQGDRSYNDLSKWWYVSQTDWSAGIKSATSFMDDAQFYYSTNIDAYSLPGALKLDRAYSTYATLSQEITCGNIVEIASTIYPLIGTLEDSGSSRPHVYTDNGSGYTALTTTTFGTNQLAISRIFGFLNIGWALSVGAGTSTVAQQYNGTSWTDQTANIAGVLPYSLQSTRAGCVIGSTAYIAVENESNNYTGIVKTSVASPASSSDFTKVLEKNTQAKIIAMCGFQGNLYYFLYNLGLNQIELRMWNIAGSVDTSVWVFDTAGMSVPIYGVDGKVMVNQFGKLVLTIGSSQVWTWDGSQMVQVFKQDDAKVAIGAEASACLEYGCVVFDNKCWWGNLIYDGLVFFNYVKDAADSTTNKLVPIYAGDFNRPRPYYTGTADRTKVYNTGGLDTYKKTADKNFLVMSNLDNVAGIDKLAFSLTLIFKKLVSSQKIVVKYTTGELTSSTSWTTLGSADFSVDGGTVTSKNLKFGDAVIYKKLWLWIGMEGSGANTPELYDVVMEYLPLPNQTKTWQLTVMATNELERLDGKKVTVSGREARALAERAWMTKSILEFQDLDYAKCLTTASLSNSATSIACDDTSDFPEQGRLLIDNEEIFYTGKTRLSFTGLIRGQRGTVAMAHSSGATVYTGYYKVLVSNFAAKVPIIQQDKELESTISFELREVGVS